MTPNEVDLKQNLCMKAARGFLDALASGTADICTSSTVRSPGRDSSDSRKRIRQLCWKRFLMVSSAFVGFHVGELGLMNDLNILDLFRILQNIMKNLMHFDFTCQLHGKMQWLLLYLVRSKVPKRSIFIDAISETINRKNKHFNAAQK